MNACKRLPVLAVALAVSGLALLGVTPPVGAAGRPLLYGTTVVSQPVSTFAEIPVQFNQGSPSAIVLLDDQGSARCETQTGVYDLGILDEYASISVERYQNPTRLKALNPPDSRPDRAQFGSAPGPTSLAECKAPTSGHGVASWGGGGGGPFTMESAMGHALSTCDPGDDVVVSEALASLHGIKIGDSVLRAVASSLEVEWRPDAEPLVSYRIEIQGFSNGANEIVSSGGKGIVLSGQSVAGSDLAQQFNQQAEAHRADLSALGTYGFRIVAPRVYPGSAGRTVVEAPVLYSHWGFTARRGQTGSNQGLRLGFTRASGRISLR